MLALTQGLMSLGAGGGGGAGARRFWRLFIDQPRVGGTQFLGVTEIQFFDRLAANRTFPNGGAGPELASSVLNAGNAAYRAFDNNVVNSGWLSDSTGAPQWISWDFEHPNAQAPLGAVDVGSVRIWPSWNLGNGSPLDFRIQWSDDGIVWTTALTVTGWTNPNAETFLIP